MKNRTIYAVDVFFCLFTRAMRNTKNGHKKTASDDATNGDDGGGGDKTTMTQRWIYQKQQKKNSWSGNIKKHLDVLCIFFTNTKMRIIEKWIFFTNDNWWSEL